MQVHVRCFEGFICLPHACPGQYLSSVSRHKDDELKCLLSSICCHDIASRAGETVFSLVHEYLCSCPIPADPRSESFDICHSDVYFAAKRVLVT
jgi:hypothetical protein